MKNGSLLVVNTLPKNDPAVQAAIGALTAKAETGEVMHTEDMKIQPCVGCNFCWLKTPGVCAIRDDYEALLRALLRYDTAVLIAGTALGFLDHRAKHIVDRTLPLATMYTHVVDGQMRHIPRYDKRFRFGLLYAGAGEREYLTYWMKRFALNLGGNSLGAFPIEEAGEVSLCV
ncbi:flavodoxin family protein [Ruminococcus sp. zg-924]|nr:flavodoxin family protein [Ruminococcus sp. zg-924]MCQ4022381.1 flavodoxin family protein [Ruminococcus sp. zg-924]MCQ4114709.1 flavodoxin family protein [Ruminococcus sp. zg-921]